MEKIMANIIKELNARGYETTDTVVIKNGVIMFGVIIGSEDIRPTIYVNEFIKNGLSVAEISDKIIEMYEQAMEDMPDINIPEITSWDYAKDNLLLCVQKKSSEDIIKKDFLDLEVYVRVKVRVKITNGSYKVNSCNLQKLGITEEELFKRAYEVTKENIFIEDMRKAMAQLMGFSVDEIPLSPEDMLLVLSNKEKSYGASAILFPDVLKSIAEEYNSNLVILPSSIHECIIKFDDMPNAEVYNNMVREVNENEVLPEEVLSDHAYRFDRKSGKVEVM